MDRDKVALTQQVKDEARRLGARIVGVGSPDRWRNAPKGHAPQDFVPDAKAVIALGLPLFKGMSRWREFMKGSEMFSEEDGQDKPVRLGAANQMYRRMQYDAVNLELMSITYRLAAFLNDLGYDVVTPPITGGAGWANAMVDEMYRIYFHQWSQRHAAVACGLGDLGLNAAFLCPEYGLRVRLGSVITNAPLAADPLDRIGTTCTRCGKCVEACADPKTFGDPTVYELVPGCDLTCCTFDKDRCERDLCAQCTLVCPVGK